MSQQQPKAAESTKRRHRSPNYPGVSLRNAVEKMAKQYKADGIAGASRIAVLKNMGYDNPTGEAGRLLSALKSYGLMDESDGRVKFTQRGLDIVARHSDSPQHQGALRQAALSPQIYRELITEYPSGLPSEATLKSELIAVKKFNPNAVDDFVRDFKVTLEFAGISDVSSVASEVEGNDAGDISPDPEPRTLGKAVIREMEHGKTIGQALSAVGDKMRGAPLLLQTLVVSIPRGFTVDINVRGDELKKEDLAKIKSQFTRWIEGLEEAFED